MAQQDMQAISLDDQVLLLAFSAAMFAGAFGAGYIPLSCAISQSRFVSKRRAAGHPK